MIVIKVPGLSSEKDNSSSGCRNSGNALLKELGNIESNESGKIIDKNILDLEEIHVNNSDLDEQDKLIYTNSLEEFGKQDKIIFLGGDHSISFSIGRSFLQFCREKEKIPCLIVFDAHADC